MRSKSQREMKTTIITAAAAVLVRAIKPTIIATATTSPLSQPTAADSATYSI